MKKFKKSVVLSHCLSRSCATGLPLWFNGGVFMEEVEVWKPVPGYEGHYEASTFGRIRSISRYINAPQARRWFKGVIFKGKLGNAGYLLGCFIVDKKKQYIGFHKVVAETFIPNPDNKPWVNHKDCNKLNNRVGNLEWCTPSENNIHAYENGANVSLKGEQLKTSKLTGKQALEIFNSNLPYKELCKIYNISYGVICDINNGRSWAHVTGHYDKKRTEKFSKLEKFKHLIKPKGV